MKNDGTWKAKPSGLKSGNLTSWKDMMSEVRPEPEVDDIIVDRTTTGEIIGYLCTVANGYDSYWKRVAKPIIVKSNSGSQQRGGFPPQPIYYTKRAKEALGSSIKQTPSLDFDEEIPF